MVGESFRRWPKEMRFISPSFNQQGWTNSFDLNSVAFGTSPAYTLGTEHPTGIEYACYLSALAESNELNIRFLTEVNSVRPQTGGGFEVDTMSQASAGMLTLCSRYVIWAAGEFQYPRSCNNPQFPGSEICCHNSGIQSWEKLPGDNFVIIGGCVALRLSLTSHTMVPLTPLFTRSSAIPCPRDHPVHSPCTSRLVPRTKGTRAELTRRLIWPRLASGAPCSRRPPLGTPGPWTHPPSWHPTRPHGCAR